MTRRYFKLEVAWVSRITYTRDSVCNEHLMEQSFPASLGPSESRIAELVFPMIGFLDLCFQSMKDGEMSVRSGKRIQKLGVLTLSLCMQH